MSLEDNPQRQPVADRYQDQHQADDVWDEEFEEGEDYPEALPDPPQKTGINRFLPALPAGLSGAIQQKQSQVTRIPQVLQPAIIPQGYRPYNPQIPLYIVGGVAASVTLLGMTAIISSSLPNAQITRQQEALSAVAIEVARRPPNYYCVLAWHCPEVGTMPPVTQQGDQLNVTSGYLPPQPEVQPQLQPEIQPLTMFNPPRNRYEEWFNYWASIPMPDVHKAAATYTDVDCSRDPEMCESLNEVKTARINKGEK